MRTALCVLLVVSVCLAPTADAAPDRGRPRSAREERLHIALSGVTLHAVVQYISLASGKPVVLPDRFPGNRVVDVVSVEGAEVSGDKAMSIFATVLRGAGYAMIETDNYVQIVPEGKAEGVPLRERLPVSGLAAESLVTFIVDVQHAEATKLAPVLMSLKSRAGSIQVPAGTNRLVITEYGATLRVMLDLLRKLDAKRARYACEVYKARNTSAQSLSRLVRVYVKNLQEGTGPLRSQRLRAFSADPHLPTNSLILYGHMEDIAEVKAHIQRFDVKPEEAARKYHTYAVLHRDAKELKSVLDALMKSVGRGRDKDIGEPAPVITADEINNDLIITATLARYEEILPVIRKLDRPSAQVVIECALVELSMDKLLDLGVELSSLDGPGDRARGFGGTTFGISTITEDDRVPVLPVGGGLIGGIFKDDTFRIAGLIRLAKQDEDVSLIISPSVMTRDNRQATIKISELREYAKREYSAEGNTNVVTSGGFNEAAVELKITPHINEAGLVRLEIETLVDQFLPSTVIEGVELVNKTSRTANTEVTVRDSHTVVIGGLTTTVQVDVVSKVPILGDIPLLGILFRRTQKTNQQRNLCIFITPHIFRTAQELLAERDRKKAELRALSKTRKRSVLHEDTFEKVTGGKVPPKKTPEKP